MGTARTTWTAGSRVQHKKTRQIGRIITFKGWWDSKLMYQIKWNSGLTNWVSHKLLMFLGGS